MPVYNVEVGSNTLLLLPLLLLRSFRETPPLKRTTLLVETGSRPILDDVPARKMYDPETSLRNADRKHTLRFSPRFSNFRL